MGVQMHPTNDHARDVVQPDKWDRGNDPGRGRRAYYPKANVRPYPQWGKPSGQPRFDKLTSGQKQDLRDCMQASGVKTVQHQGLTEELPEKRPRLKNAKRRKKKRREVIVQLGGTVLSPRSSNRRDISFRVAFRQNCTEDVECHTHLVLLQLRI